MSKVSRKAWTAEELKEQAEKLKNLWESGLIRVPCHLSGGNEQELINIFKDISEEDYVCSTHRNFYHALLHGISFDSLVADLERPGGSMVHTSSIPPFLSTGIVAGGCGIAVGIAWALRELDKDKRQRSVWCFVGDGALDEGHFWEALQWAETQDLPLTFIWEDNCRATESTFKDRYGPHPCGLREIIKGHPKVRWYFYKPTYPHVGSGKYVQF